MMRKPEGSYFDIMWILPHVVEAVVEEYNNNNRFDTPWLRHLSVVRDLMLSGF